MLYVKNCKQRLNGHKKQEQRKQAAEVAATQRQAYNEIENKKEQQKNVKWQRENTTRHSAAVGNAARRCSCLHINKEEREMIKLSFT